MISFGDKEQARRDFAGALEVDQSFLFARQALAWLEAGALDGLTSAEK